MATLAAVADGNLTTLGTWAICEAELDSEAASSTTTTSYVESASFTVTAGNFVGLLLKVNDRIGTTGTVSVRIAQGGTTVTNAEVIIDADDFHQYNAGWYYFKFTGTVTLAGATNYTVSVKSSTSGSLSFFRNSTAGNWSRVLVTDDAPGSLAAGDKFIVAGAWTTSNTVAARTVTMDNTASTSWGSLSIGNNGTVTYGTSASTNYLFKVSGTTINGVSTPAKQGVHVACGGTLNIGTTGTPIPSTSTATLEFNVGANVEHGLEIRNGGTLVAQGTSKTSKCYLAADASAGATSLTTDISTGWKNGDRIGIASTTSDYALCEEKPLTADASGTTLTITALTNSHLGTVAERAARMINLTRNVKIIGTSTTLQTCVRTGLNGAVINCDSVEFRWMGSATATLRGIYLTTLGVVSQSFVNCALSNFVVSGSYGFDIVSTSIGSLELDDIVMFQIGSSTSLTRGISTVGTSGTGNLIKNIVVMYCDSSSSSSYGMYFADGGGTTFQNLEAIGVRGGGAGMIFIENNSSWSITGLRASANGHTGIIITSARDSTITNIVSFNNVQTGLNLGNMMDCVVDNLTLWGNPTTGLYFGWSSYPPNENLLISNFDIRQGYTGSLQVYGLLIGVNGAKYVQFVDGTFSGSSQLHTTADINVNNQYSPVSMSFDNVTFNATVPVLGGTTSIQSSGTGSFICVRKYNTTAGDNRMWKRGGRTSGGASLTTDTSIYNTASPSLRMYPGPDAAIPLTTPDFCVPALAGSTVNVSVYVRKNVTADGAAGDYDGSQPRLYVRKDVLAGITSDTLKATAAAAAGTWEQLTGSVTVTEDCVLRWYVDCRGATSGRWVSVDDWDAGIPVDTRGTKYWDIDGPLPLPYGIVYYPIRRSNTVMKM